MQPEVLAVLLKSWQYDQKSSVEKILLLWPKIRGYEGKFRILPGFDVSPTMYPGVCRAANEKAAI